MSDFKIERGIPAPKITGQGRGGKYPWDELEPGDSFFVPNKGGLHAPKRLTEAGRSFRSAVAEKNGVHGTRVWRIK